MKKKMGNRGSKSEFKVNSVKEQRADGSWYIKPSLIYLRCALTGFERNYQINNPSNQYNKLPFSTKNNKFKNQSKFWFTSKFNILSFNI